MPAQKINVSGIAVRAGLSLNKILYLGEELKRFAPTLKNRPILKDHYPATDNTIGLITNTSFNKNNSEVLYEGWVKEDGTGIIERIEDGRIKEVSIGGVVGRLVKENLDDDFFIAKDMRALELSTTPTPATVGTRIQQTLRQLNEAKTPEDYKRVKPVFEQVDLFNESQDIIKIVEKYACPLCEGIFEDVQALRTHMKVHNQEPLTKANLEEDKMAEETNVHDDKLKILEAKEVEFQKREQEFKVKETAFLQEKRKKLEQAYAEEAKAKKMAPQDVSKFSDDVVEALIAQLKTITVVEAYTCPECDAKFDDKMQLGKHMKDKHPDMEDEEEDTEEAKKPTLKGKVPKESKEIDIGSLKLTVAEFGGGYALYSDSYDSGKYKRLSRS